MILKTIPFTKYQANGNDLVAIDARHNPFDIFNIPQNKRICNRHFGIGSDGIIILKNVENYDFEMIYINPEGQPSSLCGNGARCMIHFASKLGIIGKKARFWAIDGEHSGEIIEENMVKLQLQNGKNFTGLSEPDTFWIDTGSPHYVKFIDESVDNINFIPLCLEIRNSPAYQKTGININFINIIEDGVLKMRSFERGVEGETLSCGTGATAAALCYIKKRGLTEPVHQTIQVHTQGGSFLVESTPELTNVWLTGAVRPVFEGIYYL